MGVRPCDDGDGISPSKAAFHSTPFFVPSDDVFSRLSSPGPCTTGVKEIVIWILG